MLTQSLPPSQSQVGAALWGLWGLQGVMDRPSLLWEILGSTPAAWRWHTHSSVPSWLPGVGGGNLPTA